MKRGERRGGWSEEEGEGRGVMKGEEGSQKWREEKRRKREGVEERGAKRRK